MTNFDISRYDVKRICSSTTLITGDLAKRSPRGDVPQSVDDALASSTLPRDDEAPTTNKADLPSQATAAASPMSNSSSSMEKRESPRNSNSQQSDCCDLSQAFYYPSHGSADCTASTSNNSSSAAPNVNWMAAAAAASRPAGFPVVHQLPMFALWND